MLLPVVMCYNCPSCVQHVSDNTVFFSDDLSHSAHFVNHVTEVVLDHLQATLPSLQKIIIFSDGCSSQYKSKVPFFSLSEMGGEIEVERCFFGSRHGKNLCDALGVTVKTAARREVKARKATIGNAADMVTFCQQNLGLPKQASGCLHKKRWFREVREGNTRITAAKLKTVPGTG